MASNAVSSELSKLAWLALTMVAAGCPGPGKAPTGKGRAGGVGVDFLSSDQERHAGQLQPEAEVFEERYGPEGRPA
eukprot:2634014-Pyramimonas_sp.AAC.1